MEGGQAVAAPLFGENAPAGRTAITWYTGTSDLPQPGDMGMYPNASKQNKGITCEGPHVALRGFVVVLVFSLLALLSLVTCSQRRVHQSTSISYACGLI